MSVPIQYLEMAGIKVEPTKFNSFQTKILYLSKKSDNSN